MANNHRGYLIPDKDKGRLTLQGKDFWLNSSWKDEAHEEMEFKAQDGSGHGSLKPNRNKSHDNQPDWRGEWFDETNKRWLASAWNRKRDDGMLYSLSLTDPADVPQRQGGSQPSSENQTPAPAPAAPAPAAPAPEPSQEAISPEEFTDLNFPDPFSPGQ